MKRTTNLNKRRGERGLMIIGFVILLGALALIGSSRMVIETATSLYDAQLNIAVRDAYDKAAITASPIKRALIEEIQGRIQASLDQHLEKYMQAKMSLPNGAPGSFYDASGKPSFGGKSYDPIDIGPGGLTGDGGGRGPKRPSDKDLGDAIGGGDGIIGGGLGGFGGGLGGPRGGGIRGGGIRGGGTGGVGGNSGAGNGNGNGSGAPVVSFICQGPIDPKLDLTEQFSVCDPVNLLRGMLKDSPLTKNQTIDLVSSSRPTDPKLLESYEWQAHQRQSANRFDYTIKTTFISQELLQAVDPGNPPSRLPKPRVERYRYLVTADVHMVGQMGVQAELNIDFDVVFYVKTFGRFAPAGAGCPNSGVELPGFGRPAPYVLDCQKVDSNEAVTCVPKLRNTADYFNICGNQNGGLNYSSACDAPRGTCDPNSTNSFSVNCDVYGDGKFFVDTRKPIAQTAPGCASKGSIPVAGGQLVPAYYTFETTVRTVSLSQKFD